MSEASHPQHESRSEGSHYQPSLIVVLVIVVLFVGASFAVLRSNNASSPGVTTTTIGTSQSSTTTTVANSTVVPKSKVRVQVANGTKTTGLARTVTQRLLTYGWDTLPGVNASAVSATVLYYNPGYLWAAKQLATEIGVSSSKVQPLNGLTPVPGASGDDVVIILGPDVAIQG